MPDLVKTLLHIGCGNQGTEALPRLDWGGEWRQLRVDIDPSVEPDIVASMTDMHMIESNSIDFVFSKHNLEHLEAHDVTLALGEFYRVLKPTGFLICRCPDLRGIAARLATSDPEEILWVSTLADGTRIEVGLIDMIFGARSEISKGNSFMAHRTGFTDASLHRAMERAGFESVQVDRHGGRMELLCHALKVEAGNQYQEVDRSLKKPTAAQV